MKTPPIRRCAFEGCTTFAAGKYCHKHRRTTAGKPAVSSAELVTRIKEDLRDRDDLFDNQAPEEV